jgi:hypothetical protein
MRTLPALLGCLALACTTSRWDRDPEEIDASLLAHVSEAEYRSINEARSAAAEAADEVAFAREELARSKGDLKIAREEQDVAEAQLDEAETRADVAREDAQRDDALARQELEDALAYRRWVEAKIRHREARVEAARAKLELAEAEHELAVARVELAKAEAVADLENPEVQELDVDAYRRTVDRRESEVADAKADLEAARTKVESKQRLIDERAESVPAQYQREELEPETEDDDGAHEDARFRTRFQPGRGGVASTLPRQPSRSRNLRKGSIPGTE